MTWDMPSASEGTGDRSYWRG